MGHKRIRNNGRKRRKVTTKPSGRAFTPPAGFKTGLYYGFRLGLMKIKTLPKKRQRIYQPRESDGPLKGNERSNRSLDLVGTEASGTCVHMAGSSIDNGLDPLDIGLPGTVGTSVGVGNLNTKGYALATKITLRHSLHLPSGQLVKLLRLIRTPRYNSKD